MHSTAHIRLCMRKDQCKEVLLIYESCFVCFQCLLLHMDMKTYNAYFLLDFKSYYLDFELQISEML